MAKVLRGEAIMRLEDIAQAERILGGIHRDAMLQIKLANEVDVNRRIPIVKGNCHNRTEMVRLGHRRKI